MQRSMSNDPNTEQQSDGDQAKNGVGWTVGDPLDADTQGQLLEQGNAAARSIHVSATGNVEGPASSTSVPADPRLPIYKDTLRVISNLLIRTDWRKLKDQPYIIESVISPLREVISALEYSRERQLGDPTELEQILHSSNEALINLYVALDAAASPSEERNERFYKHVEQGRHYLNSAIYAISQVSRAS